MRFRLSKSVCRVLCGCYAALFSLQTAFADDGLLRWSDTAKELDHAALHARFTSDFEQPLKQFLSTEIVLEKPISIEVSERPYGFYESDERLVIVPLSNIYRVFDDLKARFPQQEDVQQSILSAALQFYFLSELIRAVAIDLELRISGWDAERIDALTTVLLLESSVVDQPYLLDAAEQFLLIDRAAPSVQTYRFKTEFEADEYRLGQVLCVMKAFDSEETSAPTLDQQQCSGQYEAAMSYWANVLAERLREGAQLKKWATLPNGAD